MIVGVPRTFSNTAPGTPRTNSVELEPGIFTSPPYAMTVVAGSGGGKICAVVCATLTVYSLRMTFPCESLTTVGAYTRGTASWFTNWGIVVGSSGTWFTEGEPTAWVLWLTASSALLKQPPSGSHARAIPARDSLVRMEAELVNNI